MTENRLLFTHRKSICIRSFIYHFLYTMWMLFFHTRSSSIRKSQRRPHSNCHSIFKQLTLFTCFIQFTNSFNLLISIQNHLLLQTNRNIYLFGKTMSWYTLPLSLSLSRVLWHRVRSHIYLYIPPINVLNVVGYYTALHSLIYALFMFCWCIIPFGFVVHETQNKFCYAQSEPVKHINLNCEYKRAFIRIYIFVQCIFIRWCSLLFYSILKPFTKDDKLQT